MQSSGAFSNVVRAVLSTARTSSFQKVITAITVALLATHAKAELVYSADEVFDTDSGSSWKVFDTVEAGLAANYVTATVAQTAELFLHYAPPDSGGVLPGYDPTYGGVTDYTTSGDGTSFSIAWESSYLGDVYLPPSLIDAFGYNISYGGVGPQSDYVEALFPLVADGGGWLPVLIRSTNAADQYGGIWGVEEGVIDPDPSLIPGDDYPFFDCSGDQGCSELTSNPYFNDDGSLKTGGYLMTSSVPEPSARVLFLLGIGSLILLGRFRCQT